MSELLLCPFCGGEAHTYKNNLWHVACENANNSCVTMSAFITEAEAIAAWNSRAAMEFDNWFYLPKPKEPIVEVTGTMHAWDGTKVKTDVFYQVQEQAVINWAKELDERIIKRICEVWNSRADYHGYEQAAIEAWESIKAWNSRAERTCKQEERGWGTEGDHARVWLTCGHDCMVPTVQDLPNYCPNCGCKVVGE